MDRKPLVAGGVGVLVLALVVLPGVLGRVAHRKVDRALDVLVERFPTVKVLQRDWTPGWFHSSLVVTFALDHDEPAMAALPEETRALARLTVRSELLHGPLLGLAGFGAARITSHLVLDEPERAKLVEALGTDEPVHIATRVGFFGGGTVTLSGEGRSLRMPKDEPQSSGTLSWDAFRLSLGIGRNGASYAVSGRQPRIEFQSAEGHVVLAGLEVEGDGQRITEDLYDGGMVMRLGRLRVDAEGKPPVQVDAIAYQVTSKTTAGYTDYGVRMGCGAIDYQGLSATGVEVKEVHYDFTMGHLQVEALQALMADVRAAQGAAREDPAAAKAEIMEPLRKHGLEILAHDPELRLDRVGFATPQGEAVLKGTLRLVGATEADLAAGAAGLVPRLVADLSFEAPQALLEKLPNGATISGAGVDAGYLKRDGDRLTSHLELRAGVLTVNGKATPLPPPFGGAAAAPSGPVGPLEPATPPATLHRRTGT